MMRRTLFLCALALAVGLLGAVPAAATGDPGGDENGHRHDGRLAPRALGLLAAPCGTITEDTTLTGDVDCDIFVAGDGVTLDLAGHTVRGTVLVMGDDATVRGGTITNPGTYAVWVEGARALLDRLEVVDSGGPFAVEAGDDTAVRRSSFRGNALAVSQFFGSRLSVEGSAFTDNGIGVSIQAGGDAVLGGNRFAGGSIGVNVWDEDLVGATGTHVVGNRFHGTDIGVRVLGVADASGTVVERNTIHRSAVSGVLVITVLGPGVPTPAGPAPGGAAGTVLRDNTVTAAGSSPEPVSGCFDEDLFEDTCSTVADDGITVLSLPEVAATMTVAGNRAIRNADYGIEAPGVTDGGGNRAAANGNPDQCLGVDC